MVPPQAKKSASLPVSTNATLASVPATDPTYTWVVSAGGAALLDPQPNEARLARSAATKTDPRMHRRRTMRTSTLGRYQRTPATQPCDYPRHGSRQHGRREVPHREARRRG